MASSISNWLENEVMDAVFNDTDMSFTGSVGSPTAVYIKLHIGAPGEDGTGNAAAETTRKACSFGAAVNGVSTSDADITWTNLAATETVTAVSLWDDSSAGNCLWWGDLTASKALTATESFTIPSGSLTVTLT